MKWEKFQTRVGGKWILAGEHSVLRGAPAIAIPYRELGLDLGYDPNFSFISGDYSNQSYQGLRVDPPSASILVTDLFETVVRLRHEFRENDAKPPGLLKISSTIPIGAGLGSSAALCVAVTRWMAQSLDLDSSRLAELATQLEHRFHGKSSGMDVAVIASDEPILFAMGSGAQSLGVKKLPRFTFHDTGLRSRTSDCVERVADCRRQSLSRANATDQAMGQASELAKSGLIQYDAGNRRDGLGLIQDAMNRARQCFYDWGLVPEAARELEEKLLHEGALGVKLTGAGGGGIVVALWAD